VSRTGPYISSLPFVAIEVFFFYLSVCVLIAKCDSAFVFLVLLFIGNMDGLHSDTIPAQIASGIPVSTMDSSHPPGSAKALAAKYRRFVQDTAQRCGDFKKLNEFIEQRGQVEHQPNPSKTTLVRVVEGVADSDPAQYSSQITGDQKLAETLNDLCHVHAAGRLFIVENAGPDTMCLLGGAFDVDPQMFDEHLDTSPWYFLETIPDHLPQLQSVKRREQYVRLQFTAACVYKPSKDPDDALEFTCSDSRTAAIVRVGGKLIPRSRPGTKSFGKILLIRHSVAIWFGGPKFGARWNGRCCPFILRRISYWDGRFVPPLTRMLGIILVDPPFSPNPEEGTCEISEYRPFSGRPKSINDAGHRFPRESLRNSFQFCLSQDPSLFRASVEDPFILVRDLLKIMASEWIVVLKYMERELVTIETCLEKQNPSLYDLEAQLTDLFIHRRRAGRYRDLIVETRCWCASQGQESWPRSAGNDAPLSIALDLAEDYKAVERMVERNCERIDRNEELLTAEVAVAEGKRNASKSDSMAKLTILATIFLPFSTIASVLNMNGSFAPGQKNFWIFWATAIPINAAIFFVYAVFEVMQRCKRDGPHGVGMLLAARMKLGKSVPSSRNAKKPSTDYQQEIRKPPLIVDQPFTDTQKSREDLLVTIIGKCQSEPDLC
jgi:hypothetical protein